MAGEAAAILAGVEVNLSESSSRLAPFYVAANRGDAVPDRMSADVLRTAFNGSVWPQARIELCPLAEDAPLWDSFAYADDARWIGQWRTLITWLRSTPALGSAWLVEVNIPVGNGINYGCVFPRLVVARTQAGSLVGLMGHAVQT